MALLTQLGIVYNPPRPDAPLGANLALKQEVDINITQISQVQLPKNLTSLITPLRLMERRAIESALILCEGNVNLAASCLGIDRHTLSRLSKQYIAEDGETPRHRKVKAMHQGA